MFHYQKLLTPLYRLMILTAIGALSWLPLNAAQASTASANSIRQADNVVRTRQLTGALNPQTKPLWFEMQPDVQHTTVVLTLEFEPRHNKSLVDNVNFWLLDANGQRAVVSGEHPADVRIASGNRIEDGKLQAEFRASGEYSIVLFNRSDVAVRFQLSVDKAMLSDRSNQADMLPLTADAANTNTVSTDTVAQDSNNARAAAPRATTAAAAQTAERQANIADAIDLTGALTTSAKQHWFELTPATNDARVVLTLAYEPRHNAALADNVNVWLLDINGQRKVVNGEHPADVNMGMGSAVDTGQLQMAIDVAGHGQYTVVVFNRADIPVRYHVHVDQATLEDRANQADMLPLILE